MKALFNYPIALLILTACYIQASKVNYKDFQVFRVRPQSSSQIEELREIENYDVDVQFWTGVNEGFPSDVLVSPHKKSYLQQFLKAKNITYEVLIDNVEETIQARQDTFAKTAQEFNWNDYQPLDKINKWMETLSNRYQNVNLISIGRSYEGREVLGLQISYHYRNRIIFIDGGIHGNEWIAPATVTYFINEILTNDNPKVRSIIESRNWIIIPSLNPDGYSYSQTVDRLWRKNRRPYNNCTGTDLNRNFGYQWMKGGGSSNPCHVIYSGPTAFSEPESRNLANYFRRVSSRVDAYLTYHSYLQLYLIPFAHGGYEVRDNNDALHRMGNRAAWAALFKHGSRYLVTNAASLYPAAGTSADWVAGTFRNVKVVYTMELRDTGKYGFLLPPDQIIPCAEESFEALLSLVDQMNE